MISLSEDQSQAISALLDWFKNDTKSKKYISLGGYAGTGKTTLLAILRQKLYQLNPHLKTSFVSYTGKATRVLRSKLQEGEVLLKRDTVSTIHALIYTPVINEKKEIIGWKQKDKIESDLIIIDEASMVDEMIWKDLLSYPLPIIAIGDHGQLPPIQGNFSLMAKPDVIL